MKQKPIALIIIIILVVVASVLWMKGHPSNVSTNQPTPTPIATTPAMPTSSSAVSLSPQPSSTSAIAYCSPNDLAATLSLSGAAGSIYGTAMIKNISSTPCQIIGNNFIDASYDSSIKNLTVTHTGTSTNQTYTIQPGKAVYSQVRYQNGPQCQGPTVQDQVTFSYKISQSASVTFKNTENDNTAQVVQGCSSPTDMTEITVWNMSAQPITPQ